MACRRELVVEINGDSLSLCQFRCSETLDRKSLAEESSEIIERAWNPRVSLITELAEEDTRKRYVGILDDVLWRSNGGELVLREVRIGETYCGVLSLLMLSFWKLVRSIKGQTEEGKNLE